MDMLPNGFRNFKYPSNSSSLIAQEFLVFLALLAICCIYFVVSTFDADDWCLRRIQKWRRRRVAADSEAQYPDVDVDGAEDVEDVVLEDEGDCSSTAELIMETPL